MSSSMAPNPMLSYTQIGHYQILISHGPKGTSTLSTYIRNAFSIDENWEYSGWPYNQRQRISAKSQRAKAKSPSKILVTCKILDGDFVWPPKRKIRTSELQQSRRDTGKSEWFKESTQKETPRSENKNSRILVTCKILEFSIFERLCRFVKVLWWLHSHFDKLSDRRGN